MQLEQLPEKPAYLFRRALRKCPPLPLPYKRRRLGFSFAFFFTGEAPKFLYPLPLKHAPEWLHR